jgi:hypothetical protein
VQNGPDLGHGGVVQFLPQVHTVDLGARPAGKRADVKTDIGGDSSHFWASSIGEKGMVDRGQD